MRGETYGKTPILFKNCAGRHRPGDIAPFSILSYKQVQPEPERRHSLEGEALCYPYRLDRVCRSERREERSPKTV
jgi:hypothetical protein